MVTDVQSFAVLEPNADAFRNYYSADAYGSPTDMLVEKADLLTLTVPDMAVLIGGMRALNANAGKVAHGVGLAKPAGFTGLLDGTGEKASRPPRGTTKDAFLGTATTVVTYQRPRG